MDSERTEELKLQSIECHFGWGLEKLGKWMSDTVPTIERFISRYNANNFDLTSKFLYGCLLSYVMYKTDLAGWEILLENTEKLLTYAQNSDAEPPALFLPPWTDNLAVWSGDWETFFVAASEVDSEIGCDVQNEEEQESDDDLKDVLWVAANHVFYFLSESIQSSGCPSKLQDKIQPMKGSVMLVDEMSAADKAAVLIIKAKTARYICGVNGLLLAIKFAKQAIRLAPDNSCWVLTLISFWNFFKQQHWEFVRDRKDEELVFDTIDKMLSFDVHPRLRMELKFEKLRILWTSPHFKSRDNAKYCLCLAEELLRVSTKPWLVAFCAQVMSSFGEEYLKRAASIMDDLVKRYPDNTLVLARTSNVQKKTRNFEKALELAEKASQYGFGSCWQVLELRVRLRHNFSHEDFFDGVIKRFDFKFQKELTHKNAFLFYVCKTGEYFKALSHFEQIGNWNGDFGSDLSKVSCCWIKEKVNVIEAAYNVALFVQNRNYERGTTEELALSERVRASIEERTGLQGFRVDPEGYIKWLQGEETTSRLRNEGGRNFTNHSWSRGISQVSNKTSRQRWSPERARRHRCDSSHLNYNWRQGSEPAMRPN